MVRGLRRGVAFSTTGQAQLVDEGSGEAAGGLAGGLADDGEGLRDAKGAERFVAENWRAAREMMERERLSRHVPDAKTPGEPPVG